MNDHRLFRGAWVLTLGGVASFALSFLRNLILARLLSKADFGVAALFASALAMLESASRVPFGQQVVQAPAGDSRRFRDTAHTFQVGLALFGALLLAGFAAVGAGFFAKLDATWAIWALALVPVARGLENLDMFREQRRFNQTPGVLCEFVPQLVVTLAAWPLVLWLRDYRAVLCILVAKPLLGTIMTHLVAYEPYGLAWHRGYLRSMVRFGWPLQLNGLLMFASQQADQFLVAGLLSKEELASYALAFSLVSVPWVIFVQPAASLMLSVLSRVQDESDSFPCPLPVWSRNRGNRGAAAHGPSDSVWRTGRDSSLWGQVRRQRHAGRCSRNDYRSSLLEVRTGGRIHSPRRHW